MIKVYFETKNNGYCELVAIFESEDIYIACLPALEKKAMETGFYFVTEEIIEANFNFLH